MLRQALDRKLIPHPACGVLTGEEAFFPIRLLALNCFRPLNSDQVWADLWIVGILSHCFRHKRSIKNRNFLTVNRDSEFLYWSRCVLDDGLAQEKWARGKA